jgi:HlyD family secretion protein
VRIDQESDRVTEERRIYVRCRTCAPQHQLRILGEQAEVEVVKRTIARGLFVPLKFVERYNGRTGVVWVVENGRLAKREVQFGERLLDGSVEITEGISASLVIVTDDRSDMREGRAARPVAIGGS